MKGNKNMIVKFSIIKGLEHFIPEVIIHKITVRHTEGRLSNETTTIVKSFVIYLP